MHNQTNKPENQVVNLLSDTKIIDSWHRNAHSLRAPVMPIRFAQ
jgi:hypothetical protein